MPEQAPNSEAASTPVPAVGSGHDPVAEPPTPNPGAQPPPRALVTGASAGIGRVFASRLAADGYDLVLVARDAQRLAELAGELHARFGTDARVLAADLSTAEGIAAVEEEIACSRIDVLVNNAGFGLRAGYLESSTADLLAMHTVLDTAVLRLSRAAALRMRERGRGGILTVASMAALTAGGTYAASKAAAVVTTETLARELADSPVTVTAVLPGFVRSEFHSRATMDTSHLPRFAWLSADQVVTEALADARRGRVISIPSRRYRLAAAALRFLPRSVVRELS